MEKQETFSNQDHEGILSVENLIMNNFQNSFVGVQMCNRKMFEQFDNKVQES